MDNTSDANKAITIDVNPITGGTDGRVLFQKAGKVSENVDFRYDNDRLEVPRARIGGDTGFLFSSNTISALQNAFVGIDVLGGRSFNITDLSFSKSYFKIAEFTGNIGVNNTNPLYKFHQKTVSNSTDYAHVIEQAGTGTVLFGFQENGTLQIAVDPIYGSKAYIDGTGLMYSETGFRFGNQLFINQNNLSTVFGSPITFFANKITINSDGKINTQGTPVFSDNASALSGGLVVGDNYRTATGVKMEVY